LRAILLNGLRIGLRDRTDGSEAQLEDFAQESLLRILKRLDQFEGRSKFVTWAYAIAINTAFAELRRNRWQDVSLEALTADGRQLHERLIEILRMAVAEFGDAALFRGARPPGIAGEQPSLKLRLTKDAWHHNKTLHFRVDIGVGSREPRCLRKS